MSGRVTELLPCPFCGSEVRRDDRTEYEHWSAADNQRSGLGYSAGGITRTTYAIQCECGTRIEANNGDFMVRRWNRRAAPHMREGEAVDLEQFRKAVEFWKALAGLGEFATSMQLPFPKTKEEYVALIEDADRLLAVIDNSRSKP